MWFLLAALSAVFYSLRGILEKTTIHQTNRHVLGFGIRLFALPFFLIPFFIQPDLWLPVHELPGKFWLAVVVTSLISTPLETLFYYKAIKQEELSLALPILSLSPILTIGFAAVALGEYPSLFGALGVLIILLGVYTLKLSSAREGILTPLKHLSKSKGVQFMAIVACSLAFGSVLDKMGVQGSNVYMYAFCNYALVSVSLCIIAKKWASKDLYQLKTHSASLLLIGLVVAGYTLLYLLALQQGSAAYVAAIRNASVLLSIVLGILVFKEKDTKAKILAGSLIFVGLIFIKVLG